MNDSILRIVVGAVGAGGSAAFTTWNAANPSVGATTLAESQIPSHTHTVSPYLGSPTGSVTAYPITIGTGDVQATILSTGATGGGLSHTHTGIGAPSIKYNDFIIASKD